VKVNERSGERNKEIKYATQGQWKNQSQLFQRNKIVMLYLQPETVTAGS